MSDIGDLHGRLAAAMDQISEGLQELSPISPDELASLRSQLEHANAQIESLQNDVAAAQTRAAQAEDMRDRVAALDEDLQKLRQINAHLRDTVAALREANQAGLASPELINSSLQAELEALRAARATETAEASAILSALAPILSTQAAAE